MSNTPAANQNPVLVTRMIWGALLMGEIMFFFVILAVIWPQRANEPVPPPGSSSLLMFYVACVLLALAGPAAFAARLLIFRNRNEQGLIQPQAYVTGTIVFLALLEGVAFFGLVNLMLAREMWPHVIVPAISVFLQVISFPTGGNVAVTTQSS